MRRVRLGGTGLGLGRGIMSSGLKRFASHTHSSPRTHTRKGKTLRERTRRRSATKSSPRRLTDDTKSSVRVVGVEHRARAEPAHPVHRRFRKRRKGKVSANPGPTSPSPLSNPHPRSTGYSPTNSYTPSPNPAPQTKTCSRSETPRGSNRCLSPPPHKVRPPPRREKQNSEVMV
jgi:hypothetical protein